MKIDRLIGILTVLLQKGKVTAPYLAEKFEVSRRTISRDIDDLCRAGVPLSTVSGKHGGISIAPGYAIEKTLLTQNELRQILEGLSGLDSVSNSNHYRRLMEKLSGGEERILPAGGHIRIDLSSWYRSALIPKIELLSEAIEDRQRVKFLYCSPNGDSVREVEPCLLVFQWASWYLWGYCLKRKDFRLFKLNRMLELEGGQGDCLVEELPEFVPHTGMEQREWTDAKVRFSSGVKWRLIDEFGAESFLEDEDKRLLFSSSFCDKDTLFRWLISFGGEGELLAPVSWRAEYREYLKAILKKYES